MAGTSPSIDQLLREFRRAIIGIDQAMAREILVAHRAETRKLQAEFAKLRDALRRAEEIEDAERWVRDTDAAQRLLAASVQGGADFGQYAAERIETRRQQLIELSAVHDEKLTYASIVGDAQVVPATAKAIRAAFTAIPVEAVTQTVGALQTGSPLRDLFDVQGTTRGRRLGETLVDGITRGQGAEQIARRMRADLDGDAQRALVIARTEPHRAYTSASLERYRANPRVYAGWSWHANLDRRTCPVCISMHGSEHPLDEEMGRHPACRCRPMPITRTLMEILGRDDDEVRALEERRLESMDRLTGPEWFSAQTSKVQREILGPLKLARLDAGDIELRDVVVNTNHERWGPGRRTGSEREALARAKRRRERSA